MNYPNAINSPTAKELSRGTIIELAQNVYENALYIQQLVKAFDPEKTYLNEVAERAETAADASRVYAENAQADADRASLYVEKIIDTVLPVGIQISNSNVNFNPNNVYLGTSWVRVSGFLYGVTDNARVGETGGEETHILNVNEMPAHSHTVNPVDISYPFTTTTGGNTQALILAAATGNNASLIVPQHNTENTGLGQAHNNMPPYKATIIWERVS